MDTSEIVRLIEEDSGMSETAHITAYKGSRVDGNGESREITVEVRDAGESAGDSRYSVSAYSEDDNKEAHGNEAGRLDEAIAIMHAHWGNLD